MKPTYKPRLPNWLSYPVGTQVLQSSFRGIHQFDDLVVQFHQQQGISATAFRHSIELGTPHLIVAGGFERWDKRPSIGDAQWEQHLKGFWSVAVYPVARDKKSSARALLVEDGLPTLRRWFEATRAPSWHWGRKRCNVIFDPLELTITSEEVVEKV